MVGFVFGSSLAANSSFVDNPIIGIGATKPNNQTTWNGQELKAV